MPIDHQEQKGAMEKMEASKLLSEKGREKGLNIQMTTEWLAAVSG